MATPWRNAKQQAQYEEQLPDRFEDAGDWITLADKILRLDDTAEVVAREYGIYIPLPRHGRQSMARVPGVWTVRDDYEQLRMRAKYASLAGERQAIDRLNELYVDIRRQRTPTDVRRFEFSITVLQQYLLEPDRRLPFSRILSKFGIAPGQRIK